MSIYTVQYMHTTYGAGGKRGATDAEHNCTIELQRLRRSTYVVSRN